MELDKETEHAMSIGRKLADKVLAEQDKALKIRAAAVKKPGVGVEGSQPAIAPNLLEAVGGSGHNGVLVAEGDSWFWYLGTDVLSVLESTHGYEVEDVAWPGHRIQEMAYDEKQLVRFTRKIQKVIRRGEIPKAILLSGGGNDVAGKEFAILLNDARSLEPGLSIPIVQEIIDQRIKNAYVFIISAVTQVCMERLGHTIPILVHGYDYAVPDGRGFWIFPAWLEPGFKDRAYEDLPKNTLMIQELIDRLNEMLIGLTTLSEFKHVKHIELRKTLPNNAGHETWWANELHPTKKGFELVAEKFAEAVESARLPRA